MVLIDVPCRSRCMANACLRQCWTAKSGRMYVGAFAPKIECLRYCAWLNGTTRHADAQKYMSLTLYACAMAQVLDQSRSNFIGERHVQRRADLRAWHSNHASPPLNILKLQTGHLADAKTVGGNQKQHRVIAGPLDRGTVDRLE